RAKVAAGVDVLQLFDSWGGMLSPEDYREFSWPYLQQIIDALKDLVPVIVFAKGCWFALGEMAGSGASALGVDWSCSPQEPRRLCGSKIILLGNFDPARRLSPPAKIAEMVERNIREFVKNRYEVNMDYRILPN